MKKKRVNLCLSDNVMKELKSQSKKYGIAMGNYVSYLILKEQETEQRERESRILWNKAKIWI